MQIFEVTQPSILKTIGQDIKGAVTAPFQKASAVMATPGALTDPHAYRDAMQKYRGAQAAQLEPAVQQKLNAQIAQKTQQRAKELAQQWLQVVKSKQPLSRLKSAPTPIKPTGQYATKPAPGTTIDMEPGALTVREQDEPIKIGDQPIDPKDPKYAQLMAKLPRRPATVTAPPSGFAGQNYTQDPNTKQWYKIGSQPPTGGKVSSQTTATPKTILTGNRAKEFETWASQQLASTIPGTRVEIGLDKVKQDPKVRQALNTALTQVIRSNNDPRAVEQYFTTAMQAMQQLSAQLKQSGQVAPARGAINPTAAGVLDRYVEPVAAQKLKDLAKNPTYAEILKKELGIT